MQIILSRWMLLIAVSCAHFMITPSAAAEDVPAKFIKNISCSGNWANSFWDIGTGLCWECPRAAPKRTIFPVTGGWACEKPAHEEFRRAKGPMKPTGWIGTDCKSGWFLDIGHGKCYSCEGYNRSLHAVTHPRACSILVPLIKAKAIKRGSPSCPEGSFQHLLSSRCYFCPAGSYRNANTGADPSTFGACTICGGMGGKPCPVTTLRKSCNEGLVENILMGKCTESDSVLFAKLERDRAIHTQRQNKMVKVMAASSMASAGDNGKNLPNEVNILFGTATDAQRRKLMQDLLSEMGGGIVTLVSGGSASLGLGYGHMEGWAMNRTGSGSSSYNCRRIWNNAFTAGLSAGGSGGWETGAWTSASFDDLAGETNGIQGGLTLLVVGWTPGTHWSASTGEHAGTTIMSGTNAMGLDIGVDYVHGWTDVEETNTPCTQITW